MSEPVKTLALADAPIDLASPAKLVEFATTLKSFIVQQGLFTPIKGKNYVNVEGWQFAGGAMGIMPILQSLERIRTEDAKEIRYRAEIELQNVLKDNQVVGRGVAICSNKEDKRDKQDEYVIASMAQTRAIGKAYRNAFAWLMKMAGYEVVPAEEMTSPAVQGVDLDITAMIENAATAEELGKLFDELTTEDKKTHSALIEQRLQELRDAAGE